MTTEAATAQAPKKRGDLGWTLIAVVAGLELAGLLLAFALGLFTR